GTTLPAAVYGLGFSETKLEAALTRNAVGAPAVPTVRTEQISCVLSAGQPGIPPPGKVRMAETFSDVARSRTADSPAGVCSSRLCVIRVSESSSANMRKVTVVGLSARFAWSGIRNANDTTPWKSSGGGSGSNVRVVVLPSRRVMKPYGNLF